MTPEDYERLHALLDKLGLKTERNITRRQLDAGHNITTISDEHSSYQADFIIQKKGRLQKRAGYLGRTRTFYHAPEALILAKLRMVKATRPKERSVKDREDIRAILHNTKVDKPRILRLARKETTLTIFQEIASSPY